MCFGNHDKRPQLNIGEPPPVQEMLDMIDEITGTKSVIVTGANGRKQRVNTRLPRSPEEAKRFELGEQLISSTMKSIQQLYKYDPQSMIDFAPLIDTFSSIDEDRMKNLAQVADLGNIREDVANFKDMKRTLVDEEFRIRQEGNEQNLARSGRGGGTYAAESRAALARNKSLAHLQGDIEGSIYGEEMAAKRLAINEKAFGLNEAGRQGKLQSAEGQYDVLKADEAEQEQRRLSAIAEQQNLHGIGTNVVKADLDKALQNTNAATAISEFNAVNGAQMSRYNADVNRQKINHDAAVEAHKNKAPSFMESALRTGADLGLSYFTGGMTTPGTPGMNSMQSNNGFGSRVGINTVGRMRR